MSFNNFKSKRIKVFKNGDIFSPAKKLVISTRIYRNYEQFLHGLSMSVRLDSGAVRKLYTLNGKLIHGWDAIEDNGMYVASSGDTFKNVPYPLEAGEVKIPTREERLRVSAKPRKQTTVASSHFTPETKAMRIVVFRNGGFNEPTGRLLINHKNCKSFSQLFVLMSELITFQNGQVRKVHDAATGKRITSFKEMYDGQNLVGVGYEPFKSGTYKTIKLETNSQEKKPEEPRRKVITLYPNGDSFHNGWTVSVKPARFPTLQKLFDHLNKQISLVTGMICQIYTLEGQKVDEIAELQQGGCYVLVSGDDAFVDTEYNINNIELEKSFGLQGATTSNNLMSQIRRPYQPLYDPEAKSRPRTRNGASRSASPAKKTSRDSSRKEIEEDEIANRSDGDEIYEKPTVQVFKSKSRAGSRDELATKSKSRAGSRDELATKSKSRANSRDELATKSKSRAGSKEELATKSKTKSREQSKEDLSKKSTEKEKAVDKKAAEKQDKADKKKKIEKNEASPPPSQPISRSGSKDKLKSRPPSGEEPKKKSVRISEQVSSQPSTRPSSAKQQAAAQFKDASPVSEFPVKKSNRSNPASRKNSTENLPTLPNERLRNQ